MHTPPFRGRLGQIWGSQLIPILSDVDVGPTPPHFGADWGSFGVPNGSQPHQMKTWDTNIPISGQFWGSQLILFISDVDVGPTHPHFGSDWGSFGVPNSSQPHRMSTLDPPPIWGSFGAPNAPQPHQMRTWDTNTPILGQIGADLGLPTHPNPIR